MTDSRFSLPGACFICKETGGDGWLVEKGAGVGGDQRDFLNCSVLYLATFSQKESIRETLPFVFVHI